jgi:CheY-like chemotaxis protein
MASELKRESPFIQILWVDDDKVITAIGKLFIHHLGHFADIAGNGEEALKMLDEKRYDLLISDLGMPIMDGWQLAEKIKGKFDGMKVAIITGLEVDFPNEKKEEYGIGHILKKPITIEDMRKLIGEVI